MINIYTNLPVNSDLYLKLLTQVEVYGVRLVSAVTDINIDTPYKTHNVLFWLAKSNGKLKAFRVLQSVQSLAYAYITLEREINNNMNYGDILIQDYPHEKTPA